MEDLLILINLLWFVVVTGLFFIGKNWLKSAVQYSVKHHYDEMLESIKNENTKANEEQKRQHEIRMKSALIAELMAEWVSHPQDMKNLRKLTNEAFLWLPADLATELSKVLSKKQDAIDYRDFFSRVRKHLLGRDDSLDAVRFITFDLSTYEIAEIARKNIEAHSLVKFPDSSYQGKPLNQGNSDNNA
ncbi:MAG: hypothetical protein RSA84_11010 [Acinetobacter sp.]